VYIRWGNRNWENNIGKDEISRELITAGGSTGHQWLYRNIQKKRR
jgi:hypothetical protein